MEELIIIITIEEIQIFDVEILPEEDDEIQQ